MSLILHWKTRTHTHTKAYDEVLRHAGKEDVRAAKVVLATLPRVVQQLIQYVRKARDVELRAAVSAVVY